MFKNLLFGNSWIFTWGEFESLDRASRAAPGGEDVFSGGVNFGVAEFANVWNQGWKSLSDAIDFGQ